MKEGRKKKEEARFKNNHPVTSSISRLYHYSTGTVLTILIQTALGRRHPETNSTQQQ